MKLICTHILPLCLVIGLPVSAQSQKTRRDSTTVTIQLNNSHNKNAPVDSVIVIFDKHNLTGAGTIKQLFYPVNNEVIIPNVPEGKYYIDILCLGIYHQSFSEISYVYEKKRNKNKFRFHLKPAEEFNRATVYIPKEKIDPLKLTILHPKTDK